MAENRPFLLGYGLAVGLAFIAGVVACLIAQRADDSFFEHTHVVSKTLGLTSAEGAIGELPKGTYVLSSRKLSSEPDIGWFGCVPLAFPTGLDANEMLRTVERWDPASSHVIGAQIYIGREPESESNTE